MGARADGFVLRLIFNPGEPRSAPKYSDTRSSRRLPRVTDTFEVVQARSSAGQEPGYAKTPYAFVQMSETIFRHGFARLALCGDRAINSIELLVGPQGFEPWTNGL